MDETDLVMCSQLDRAVATRTGEAKDVTIFFSDIVDFTAVSQHLSPYDVMYLLNRYFVEVGDIIERNEGFTAKFVGDGMMAVFGMDDRADAPLSAVNAALQTLDAVDRMKPFFASMYGVEFDIRIGLHFGQAVIGSVGSIGHERLTAIGDAVNVASRIEAANKEAGTRLLISEALYAEIETQIEVADFVRVRLRGTDERITLYKVDDLKPEARSILDGSGSREAMIYGGKTWTRAFGESELDVGDRKVLSFGDLDVVILRLADGFHAFNNACPHMRLPLCERRDLKEGDIGYIPGTDTPRPLNSVVTDDRGLMCSWHIGGLGVLG
ncbi:MAG: Rieske 2Fe-2S domain-containing protein [Rhizobiales bacterium]|nr:Rieske 2Fe-2S domain-containing protein [Hyphomicrobiales bacterium]